jgi:hypothetical protein
VDALLIHRLRRQLAAFLVGLLMLVSAAPCAAFSAPRPQPGISAPADPCRSHNPATPCACAQLACQHAAELGEAFSVPAAIPSAATFHPVSIFGLGRVDAPPLPPPRLLS